MNIILFGHPIFTTSQSMPRYVDWLSKGMTSKGHNVEIWLPQAKFYNLKVPSFLKKWMGYIDQFILFPIWIKQKIKQYSADTLFVFTDHALGPWVPLVAHRPHIIHCHDFLAQQSALGLIEENKTSLTGKLYQAYIRNGYKKGKNFISVSQKTQLDLHNFLGYQPNISEVVYNGLTQVFAPSIDIEITRRDITKHLGIILTDGYLLHVGGNQWYKNRIGVIIIYNAWCKISSIKLPLLLVGEKPDNQLKNAYHNSPYQGSIYFIENIDDFWLQKIYQSAKILIFPSLAEGFGWPILEAMASGCPVITTNIAPMNEVGGEAASYIDRMPTDEKLILKWGMESAVIVENMLRSLENNDEFNNTFNRQVRNLMKFDSDLLLTKIENEYSKIN